MSFWKRKEKVTKEEVLFGILNQGYYDQLIGLLTSLDTRKLITRIPTDNHHDHMWKTQTYIVSFCDEPGRNIMPKMFVRESNLKKPGMKVKIEDERWVELYSKLAPNAEMMIIFRTLLALSIKGKVVNNKNTHYSKKLIESVMDYRSGLDFICHLLCSREHFINEIPLEKMEEGRRRWKHRLFTLEYNTKKGYVERPLLQYNGGSSGITKVSMIIPILMSLVDESKETYAT